MHSLRNLNDGHTAHPKRQSKSSGRASCHKRLLAWLEMVAKRAAIWGDVDLTAFCKTTGFSREHVVRTLSRIRREVVHLVFETKQRRKRSVRRVRRSRWGVMVAEVGKLKFDRRSLFFDERGRYLHNYTSLSQTGFKIEPTMPGTTEQQERDGDEAKQTSAKSHGAFCFKGGVCDESVAREGCGTTQPIDLNSARRCFNRSIEKVGSRVGAKSRFSGLRRRAFVMIEELEALHWDNCKVRFARRTAFCYIFSALRGGHDRKRIVSCYQQALEQSHGFAVDRGASLGQIVFFELSSTVSKARKALAQDGLTPKARMQQWYAKRAADEEAIWQSIFAEQPARSEQAAN
jgi:hypothetical protein